MKKHLFTIIEMWQHRKEEYSLVMTDREMKNYLKIKRKVNGYIPGVGGDRNYVIVAVYAIYYTMPRAAAKPPRKE